MPGLFLFDLCGSYFCGQVSGRAVRRGHWVGREYNMCNNHGQMTWYVHKKIGSLGMMYSGVRVD